MTDYQRQHRGDRGAYERYLAGMDASMKQKVALTAAHLLGRGTVADMGMGSGTGTEALASLYPGLQVVGVDVNATMVEMARTRYTLPNLSFVCGDIAKPCVVDGSLDGIFDSSVLHHVTSFSGYDHEAAARCLEVQVRELPEHGTLIVRDFVDPGAGDVWLDLPAGDGDGGDDPRRCSTAALLPRFAREFRKLAPRPGFAFETLPGAREGLRRHRLSMKMAAEFVLRKDYRDDWDSEVLEEYIYFTQQRFEALFARLGLRILASTPLRSPWIVRHRFRGRSELSDTTGAPLEWPPTNYLIAGEKVPQGEGVRFGEAEPAAPVGGLPDSRLELNVYRLLRRLGRDAGSWIGEALELGEAEPPARVAQMQELRGRPRRRAFERAREGEEGGFLALNAAVFEEHAADGGVVARRTLEFVLPRTLSFNTMAVAALRRCGDEVYIGIDDDELPAAQAFTGGSELLVAPAWRLPRELCSTTPARAWVLERLRREHGLECGAVFELGGRYHPAPGSTPEVVYPIAVEVRRETGVGRPLLWVRLSDLVGDPGGVHDGPLLTLSLRAAHALGGPRLDKATA